MRWTVKGHIPSMKNKIQFAGGHAYYKNDEIKVYKSLFSLQTPKEYKQKERGDVAVRVKYYMKDLRSDVHNKECLVFDCLQDCDVIKNDRQIKEWVGVFGGVDKTNPRIEIEMGLI